MEGVTGVGQFCTFLISHRGKKGDSTNILDHFGVLVYNHFEWKGVEHLAATFDRGLCCINTSIHAILAIT